MGPWIRSGSQKLLQIDSGLEIGGDWAMVFLAYEIFIICVLLVFAALPGVVPAQEGSKSEFAGKFEKLADRMKDGERR